MSDPVGYLEQLGPRFACPHPFGHFDVRAAAECQLRRHTFEHGGAFEGCPIGACEMAAQILARNEARS